MAGPGTTPTAVIAAPGDPGAAPDLSPVEEPAHLVGIVRFKSVRQTLDSVGQTAGLPAKMLDAGASALTQELFEEALEGQADGRRLAEVVALDAPIDALVSLEDDSKRPSAHVAVAIGLMSLEGAKGAAESAAPLTEIAPGMWLMGGKERREPTCAIAASSGPTPARLICGARDKDLRALGPYLARTMSIEPAPVVDMTAELRIRPLDDRFGKDLRKLLPQVGMLAEHEVGINEPKFDKAVGTAAAALANELSFLVADLESLHLKLGLTNAGVTGTVALSMSGNKSWVSQVSADSVADAGPPPEMYWRLPKESHSAFFSQGTDPKHYAGMLEVGRDLIVGALRKAKVGTPADQEAIAALLRAPLAAETDSVQASGTVAAPAKQPGSAQLATDAFMAQLMGWHLVGFNEGPDALSKWIKDAVAAYNRPALQAVLKKELGSDAKHLPVVRQTPAPPGLGAGSFAVEIRIPQVEAPPVAGAKAAAGGKRPNVNLTIYLVLMPDGDTTWVAVGADRADLAKRLASVKKGAPSDATLASRAGLDALKEGKLTSGGFMTVASFTSSISQTLTSLEDADGEAKQLAGILNNLPNQGSTPILFTGATQKGGQLTSSMTLRIPSGSLKDIAVAATKLSDL